LCTPVFTSLRFFDKIAYAVTFEQTDPFYVISFEDPEAPQTLGQLEITGFSRYLHPINSDNTLLLGIGQEADENGVTLGLQISLFDATNPVSPTLLHRYPENRDEDVWMYSSAEFEERAFRYLKIDEESGRLIIPMSYVPANWTDTHFDGFSIFSVTADDGIVQVFDVSHYDDTTETCWGCAYLAERSFVVDGDVITLKGHSARSYDLDTGASVWAVDFAGEEGSNCCGWW
jgi:hypothetical protein